MRGKLHLLYSRSEAGNAIKMLAILMGKPGKQNLTVPYHCTSPLAKIDNDYPHDYRTSYWERYVMHSGKCLRGAIQQWRRALGPCTPSPSPATDFAVLPNIISTDSGWKSTRHCLWPGRLIPAVLLHSQGPWLRRCGSEH